MMILDLVNPSKSDIPYKISNMPDGQHQVTVDIDKYYENLFAEGYQDEVDLADVLISSRMNNWIDLEKIVCAVASLRVGGVKNINLKVPYFLGARSDRQFEEGGNNYLRDVICPVINSLNFDSVCVFDPHSDVLEGCLKNFTGLNSNALLASWALKQLSPTLGIAPYFEKCILVCPDGGAIKKMHKLADEIGYTGDIVYCSKTRGLKGELSDVKVSFGVNNAGKDAIIIDDICDGGRTFTEIAERINGTRSLSSAVHPSNHGKNYLIVTHGIFSKGFENFQHFNGVFCTNSYSDLTGYDWASDGIKDNFVKQMDIF